MKNIFSKEQHLRKLKEYALAHKFPIIQEDTGFFLQNIIKQYNCLDILEIGTAIGYSALIMSNKHNQIHTLERDYSNYQLAKSFSYGIPYKIKFIWAEALFYQPTQKYDLIFIDAAKAQYEKLFTKYSPFLNFNGIIIFDNLNFHNLKLDSVQISRSTRRLVKKINLFKVFLKQNILFKTTFYDVGDGLSLSSKKLEAELK